MEQHIRPFIKTTESVFDKLLKTKVIHGKASILDTDEIVEKWDISGIIAFSGDVSGAVVISLKKHTACQITQMLTGKTHSSIDKFVSDTTGEIANIIAGNVKKHYEDELKIKISLPSVAKGDFHSVAWPSGKAKVICIPFTIFSDQEICVSVAMAPNQ